MTFRFIDDYRTRWSVARMARVLEVSTSGYYAWKRRKPSRKSLSDRDLVETIKASRGSTSGAMAVRGCMQNSCPWGSRRAAIASHASCG